VPLRAVALTREARAAEHRRTLALLQGTVPDLAARLRRLEPGAQVV
jgi:hypothetical protein